MFCANMPHLLKPYIASNPQFIINLAKAGADT